MFANNKCRRHWTAIIYFLVFFSLSCSVKESALSRICQSYYWYHCWSIQTAHMCCVWHINKTVSDDKLPLGDASKFLWDFNANGHLLLFFHRSRLQLLRRIFIRICDWKSSCINWKIDASSQMRSTCLWMSMNAFLSDANHVVITLLNKQLNKVYTHPLLYDLHFFPIRI